MKTKTIAIKNGYNKYQLDTGLQIQSSLSHEDFGIYRQLVGYEKLDIKVVNSEFNLRKETVAWQNNGTPLDQIIREGVDPLPYIMELSRVKEQVTVLDWGCGEGVAISELLKQVKLAGLSNVKFIGLSSTAYQEWKTLDSEITLIFDDCTNLEKYIENSQVDLIYSFLGLYHLISKNPKLIEEHMLLLKRLLSPEGRILTYYTEGRFDCFYDESLASFGFKVEAVPESISDILIPL